MPISDLPIETIRSELKSTFQEYKRFVLEAPTGSGKSTQTPQMLLDEGIVTDGTIIMLQPRRLAARMLAKRISWERKTKLGEEVGYQIRFENKSSKASKILLLTEGILLRKMLSDPQLTGVSAILFDEFHERNLYSDLTLAKARLIQEQHRPDLLIGVMSATLDGEGLQNYLAPCARLQCKGRTFPVEISYMAAQKNNREVPVWEKAANVFESTAKQGETGNILIFMPGAYEISQTIRHIESKPVSKQFEVLSLHGELPPEKQDKAFAESTKPKVIVSTNVAETSLTIPGISVVIDSGQARIPSYDPHRGVNTLLVQPISQASADQRAGRAGREGPGQCIRLWGENQHHHRARFETPEINRLDLSETFLMLSASAHFDAENFPWYEHPDTHRKAHALALLKDLGALDTKGDITTLGHKMAAFPLHPRFSRLFIEASQRGCLHLAVQIAALSQDRSILLPIKNKRDEEKRLNELSIPDLEESDIYLELKALQLTEENRFNMDFCRSMGIHAGATRTAARAANQFLSIAHRLNLQPEPPEWSDWSQIGKCLLAAFSDQLAKRLDKGTLRCDLVHQRRGTRRRESTVDSEWFISSEIEERNVKGSVQIMLGKNSTVYSEWIEELFPDEIVEQDGLEWDPWQKKVRKIESKRFRGISLFEKESSDISQDDAATVVAQQIALGNIKLKKWNQQVENLIERINFVAQHFPEYEISPIGQEDRTFIIEQLIYGKTTEKELNQLEVLPAIMDWLSPEQVPMLELQAPEIIKTDGKGKLKIRYENKKAILSARIQQLYEMDPVLIGNRVPVTYELLAPNNRPVQITDDLESFWSNSYPMIKKELKGRYPKHEWR